jgi:hypothetical protein
MSNLSSEWKVTLARPPFYIARRTVILRRKLLIIHGVGDFDEKRITHEVTDLASLYRSPPTILPLSIGIKKWEDLSRASFWTPGYWLSWEVDY